MGKYWKIVNLDKGLTYETCQGKLCGFFFRVTALECGLSPRTLRDRDTLIPHFKPGDGYRECYDIGPFLIPPTAPRSLNAIELVNLPAEMIHQVFSYTENLCNALCLGLSCQRLWEIGREHIYRQIASIVGRHSWVGDRIICVGDYLENEDIPETLLTPPERAEFLPPNRTLYDYRFREIEPNFDQRRLMSMCGISNRFCFRTRQDFRDAELVMEIFLGPEFEEWPALNPVLRNLSRRQYVRESELVDLTARFPKVGLDEVLLSRICLSSDNSTSMLYDGPLQHGVWAGDRFDIVDEDWVEELGDDESWTDVSEEVLKNWSRFVRMTTHTTISRSTA
ncbi:hypothetical protein C8R47DRAFT_567748 [Mycena vitilis]|nr:hypothetical protein C8R47DRAFT_567748 [Mycena vitilis]